MATLVAVTAIAFGLGLLIIPFATETWAKPLPDWLPPTLARIARSVILMLWSNGPVDKVTGLRFVEPAALPPGAIGPVPKG